MLSALLQFSLKIHPGVIDGCIQPAFALLPKEATQEFIATHIGKLSFYGMQPGKIYLLATLKSYSQKSHKMAANWQLMNEDGKLIAEAEDILLIPLQNTLNNKLQNTTVIPLNLAIFSDEEHATKITEFFIQQIANLFSMPVHDINLNSSLQDMGLDSLMALV